MRRSQFKPWCRFLEVLPDEVILYILLTWLDIRDLANFDMALLNHMDRRAYLSLLRDTVHKGMLSESNSFHTFDSGVTDWLESRSIFMRALTFRNKSCRDIPAGFLKSTGQELLEIDINMCVGVSDSELCKFFERCPKLKIVNLSCQLIGDTVAANIAKHCPGLQMIDLTDNLITDNGLVSLGEGCRLLKTINLTGSNTITDIGISKIAASCPNLEVLFVGGCDISDKSVDSLSRFCHRLKILDISDTRVSDKGLASLGEGCRDLKVIGLKGLVNISESGIEMLLDSCLNIEVVTLRDHSAYHTRTVIQRHTTTSLEIVHNLKNLRYLYLQLNRLQEEER